MKDQISGGSVFWQIINEGTEVEDEGKEDISTTLSLSKTEK
jgi:hypothetical protein